MEVSPSLQETLFISSVIPPQIKGDDKIFNLDLAQIPLLQDNQAETVPPKEETKVEEPPKEETKVEEPPKEEVKVEEPPKDEEVPKDEIKVEKPSKEEGIILETEISLKKYKIDTNLSSYIQLPTGYSTDDADEQKAVELINETGGKWVELKKKDNYVVHIIPFESNSTIMMKWQAVINYPVDVVIKAFNDVEVRKKWDTDFGKGPMEIMSKTVEGDLTTELMYIYVKMPLIFTDRDLIQTRKTWYPYHTTAKSMLQVCTNSTHPKYPPKEKPIRCEIFIQANYFEAIGPNSTKLCSLGHIDMKFGSTFFGMMKSKSGDRVKEIIKGLNKGCKIVAGK